MTTKIDITQTSPLESGLLKKHGAAYALVALTAAHMEPILALEEKAFQDLAEHEQHYLLKKDRAFFERHFSRGGTVLGIVSEGRLIAQSIVLNPTSAHPANGMTDMPLAAPPETLTVLEGVIVDSAYRGNKLMDVMVAHWILAAKKAGRDHALAEVAVENTFSWAVFLKAGLHIEGIGIDSADSAALYNLHGHVPSLTSNFNAAAQKKRSMKEIIMEKIKTKKIKPATMPVRRQKKIFKKGMRGVAFNASSGVLITARVKSACPRL